MRRPERCWRSRSRRPRSCATRCGCSSGRCSRSRAAGAPWATSARCSPARPGKEPARRRPRTASTWFRSATDPASSIHFDLILQRVEEGQWLSNAYLIVDEIGGHGVLLDSNGVTDPLAERAEREGSEITHVLLTHSHWDHVVGVEKLAERFGVPVLAHETVAAELEGKVDETISPGDVV